jgi:hypothetical protein
MPTLAASSYGALKAYIEAQGLSLVVYKDAAPPETRNPPPPNGNGLIKAPYCTVIEGISVTPISREDGGAAQGGTTYVTELAQLDLWMNWRDLNGTVTGTQDKSLESRTLGAALYRKLDGSQLDLAPTRVYKCYVQNWIRLVERDNNIVHVAYTLAIRRAA